MSLGLRLKISNHEFISKSSFMVTGYIGAVGRTTLQFGGVNLYSLCGS